MQLRRLDLPRVAIGSVVAAALAVGLAAVFLDRARATPDVSSTAGLNEGFSTALGAGLGLTVGSALAAAIVRRGSRPVAGIVAGVVAYALVLAPIIVSEMPSDFRLGESIADVLFLLIPVGVFVVAGTALGSVVGFGFERWRGRNAATAEPGTEGRNTP
jgi:hypothetical protein